MEVRAQDRLMALAFAQVAEVSGKREEVEATFSKQGVEVAYLILQSVLEFPLRGSADVR